MSIFDGLMSSLMGAVGNNRENNEDDVSKVRSGLSTLNYRTDEDKADSIFTKPLDSAIKTFQKDEGLDQDGWLRPGGPTEKALGVRLAQNGPTKELFVEVTPRAKRNFLSNVDDEEVRSMIKTHEGDYPKFYLDTKGKPTIGVGFMIPTVEEAKTLPLYKLNPDNSQRRATVQEVENAYNVIKRQSQGKLARDYQDKTDVFMRPEDIDKRLNQLLSSHAERVRKKMPDFDKKAGNIQKASLDFDYNMNNNFTREKWKKFFDAYDRNDTKGMANESHRIDVGPDRNNSIREMLEDVK